VRQTARSGRDRLLAARNFAHTSEDRQRRDGLIRPVRAVTAHVDHGAPDRPVLYSQLTNAETSAAAPNGGYRASVLSCPSQRVTVVAVTGQSVMPLLCKLGCLLRGTHSRHKTGRQCHVLGGSVTGYHAPLHARMRPFKEFRTECATGPFMRNLAESDLEKPA
jgi:hypothetical protein